MQIRYIWESYLDALCREASWNAEGGSKCKIGHFRGSCFSVSCFSPKVTQFRTDFVIVSSKTTVFENGQEEKLC